MNFGNIEISQQAKNKISSALENKSLSHALLLTGSDLTTRTKAAKQIAAALLCEGSKIRPCAKCPACIKTKAGVHPDLILIEGEGRSRSIKIDSVRALRQQAFIIPNEAAYKIFLIFEGSDLGEEAQNALLKLIEEPPRFTRFLITAQSKEQLLPTIQSRVSNYYLGEDKKEKTTAKTAEKISGIAADIISAKLSGSEYDLIISSSALEKNRPLFQKTIAELTETLHDALRHASGTSTLTEGNLLAIQAAQSLGKEELLRCISVLKSLADAAEKNANENLLLSRLSAELISK